MGSIYNNVYITCSLNSSKLYNNIMELLAFITVHGQYLPYGNCLLHVHIINSHKGMHSCYKWPAIYRYIVKIPVVVSVEGNTVSPAPNALFPSKICPLIGNPVPPKLSK